jgi:glycosyltransferase involved in cell wall biosynthesis/CDP-glycerol glycerophosphotransferase (TagB/SpsB family)
VPDSRADAAAPFLISAVIATYNVARYLPQLLDSIEQQTYGSRNVQFVFVDDGSTDDGLAILQEWAKGREDHVIVMTQPNAWVAEARNAGLAVATGEWVTFTDPDDVLDPGYFFEVDKFIRYHGHRPEITILAAHQMRLLESGEVRDNHPQRYKFALGTRVVNLDAEPVIQLSVNSSFVRREMVEQHELRFDGRVRPNFEDGHFLARYMLLTGTEHLAVMASAKYLYRVRGDGSSLLESSFRSREKYVSVLRYGYLDLLETAETHGGVPRWLENTVLYDLFWYFKEQQAIHSLTASAPADVFDEFHELVREIRSHIAEDAIRAFDMMGLSFSVRETILRAYSEERIRHDYVMLRHVDESRQLVKISYWFSGDVPVEKIRLDGAEVQPVHETVQDYTFYGRVTIRQRHLWFRRGMRLTISLDGVQQQVARWEQQGHPAGLTAKQIDPRIAGQRRETRERFDPRGDTLQQRVRKQLGVWRRRQAKKLSRVNLYDQRLELSLRSRSVRERFAHAWVFMDRDTDANDNAEHLYRHVAQHHPEINAWFVLRKESKDWSRLEAEGFRLVEYGSWDWNLLIRHADHLASSHADAYVNQPLDQRRYGRPRFKYTFLQHGVTQDDISRWLNWKRIDVFVTTTPAEHESIAGHGPYAFSEHEVFRTSMPRYDRLWEKRQAIPASERDTILVMPTWRETLLSKRIGNSNERGKIADFAETEYARQLTALLSSPRLRELAERTGQRLAFMPHPNMRPYLEDFDLPDYVQVWSFDTHPIQDILARTSAFVTDYSSLAFDVGFLDIPMVYFQFDAASFFEGTHLRRRGYFDYGRDGYGPVESVAELVVDQLVAMGERGYISEDAYRQRSAAAFPDRGHGSAAERVVEAMYFVDSKAAPAPVDLKEPSLAVEENVSR